MSSCSYKRRSISINLEDVAVDLLNHVVKLKERGWISLFEHLILIAWAIHRWLFSFSNWLPLPLALWTSMQGLAALPLGMEPCKNWGLLESTVMEEHFTEINMHGTMARFRFHHAEPDYLMLVNWIPNNPDTLPANASHHVAVGAFVMNAYKEDGFETVCLQTQAGATLDTVEEIVEEQDLDVLFSDRETLIQMRSNIMDVAENLAMAKKNEIQHLKHMVQLGEEHNQMLRTRLQLLKEANQVLSGASQAVEKFKSMNLNYGANSGDGIHDV